MRRDLRSIARSISSLEKTNPFSPDVGSTGVRECLRRWSVGVITARRCAGVVGLSHRPASYQVVSAAGTWLQQAGLLERFLALAFSFRLELVELLAIFLDARG